MLFAAEMRILDRESARARTKIRLQPLFNFLCGAKRWEELFIIADILVLVLEWPENAELFISLLQLQDLPPLEKARAHFEVGSLLESRRLYRTADEHFQAAACGFKALGHAYGELDIEVTRSGRKEKLGNSNFSARSQDGEQQDSNKGWLEVLTEICTRYKEIAFPVGMLRALLKISELARIANDFELAHKAVEVCSEIAQETGSRFYWIQFQISMLAAALSQTGREPTVIVSGLEIIEAARNFGVPYLEGTIASILSLAYSNLAENSQSIYWAEKAADSLKDTASERSLQEYHSAVARFAQNISEDYMAQHLQELSEFLGESIERDVTAGVWRCCVDKLLLLSQVQLARYRFSSVSEATTDLEACLQRALEISEKLGESERLEIFASIQCFRVSGLLLQAKGEIDTEKERLALKCLHSALKVCDLNITPFQRAQIYCQFGPTNWSIFTKTSDSTAVLGALDAFTNAYGIFERLGITDSCITALHGIAYSLWLTGVLMEFPHDPSMLSCFLEMEKWVDLKRNELSALGTLDAIRAKQSLSTDKHLRSMYSMSLEACIRLKQLEEGWYWVQKGKARSVSDLLGLGIKIPRTLLTDLRDNSEALSLWEEEKALQATISELPQEKRGVLRGEAEILQQKMEKIDGLREVMGLRKGHAARINDLQWAFDDRSLPKSNRSIVFVDWVSTYKGNLFMFIVDESRKPHRFSLDISIADVEDWCETNFLDLDEKEETLNEEEDDDDSVFRELDALVEKLPFYSKPGDLLVLSPTGPLHSIPLHALRVPKDPYSLSGSILLIERNPVIYCPSVTILEQCVLRAQSRLEASQLSPPVVFAVYEDESEEKYLFDAAERTAIYEHAERIGQHLHAPAICGNEVTKTSFSKKSTNVPLIHFHGHCDFDSADVLAQALILSDESPGTNTQDLPDQPTSYATNMATRLCPESPNEFSVEDIFDLNLSGPHVTLIACDSASQKVSAGDEPLGILTAFLCAGAASVVGTMWPTATREGRVFSEAFYECLGNQDSKVTGIFDYAEALREAVLMIRGTRDSRLPYYWAPFVLHGAWFGKSFDIGQVF